MGVVGGQCVNSQYLTEYHLYQHLLRAQGRGVLLDASLSLEA